MTLGGLAALTGAIFQPLGQLFAWMAWPFTAYTVRVVECLASIQHGSIPLGQVALMTILVFYAFLFAFTFARSRLASGDKTGLPSPEILEAVAGYNLQRTDHNGWIELTTDGKQMWVEVERK